MSGERYSPQDIAALTTPAGTPVNAPTADQAAIIAAPLGAALVVAGAGSGKTTTMSQRAVWLVANGVARPEQILGLTFTRKAARELRQRTAALLDEFERREPGVIARPAPSADGLPELRGLPHRPAVSTYNAFAGEVYRAHALAIGQDPDATLLTESGAWLLARRLVVASHDERLVDWDRGLDTIVADVLRLAHGMRDNAVADVDAVLDHAEDFLAHVEALPFDRSAYEPMMGTMRRVEALRILLPFVAAFQLEKQQRGVMEFSDQIAAALEIVTASDAARHEIRARHPFVILDEYQDTSVVQTRLLRALFADDPAEPERAIVAVGDPNQAIYGWRGASDANLEQFTAEFGTPGRSQRFDLMTSWRNPRTVLAAANAVAEPLRSAGGVAVGELRWAEPTGEGVVASIWTETLAEEAKRVAEWFRERIPTVGERPTAAVLLRRREHLPVFAAALRAIGVDCRELGVGGLFQTPEVADLVSALRVVLDPTAGSALIRLLAGAHWRIGVRDLDALARAAQRIHRHRTATSKGQSDGASLIEALDAIVDMVPGESDDGSSILAPFSALGLERLRDAGTRFRALRARLGLPLLEFVRVVEEALLLDIEVVANETRRDGAASLRAFHDQVEAFLGTDDTATLGGFLAWVDRVLDSDERIGPAEEPAQAGVVQLLTVHAAKGLEWDLVALPRMVETEFPVKPKDTNGWLAIGELPHEFRGDRAVLERTAWLDWRGAGSRVELRDAFEGIHLRPTKTQPDRRVDVDGYKDRLRRKHQLEERRLAYVAITRARRELLLSGSHWPGVYSQSTKDYTPRPPSRYLEGGADEEGLVDEPGLIDLGLLPPVPLSRHGADPAEPNAHAIRWPHDPLAARREAVEHAAALVRAASPDGDAGAWSDDLELLLAERERAALRLEPPPRLAASQFKDWMRDPVGAARRAARPMPEQRSSATNVGTEFHRWVEERYARRTLGPLVDLEDAEPGVDSLRRDEARLARLKDRFERSRWADREPIAVERAYSLRLAGRTFSCKIDAAFRQGDRIEIVDWKTAARPSDPAELSGYDWQLELYRLAWSRVEGTDLDLVDARIYFVGSDDEANAEYAPTLRRTEAELLAEWDRAVEAIAGSER